MTYDVITLGETMLRLTPPHQQRVEQAMSYDVHVGGSESNVAVGLARLGMNVAWLSRLTDNALGRSIGNAIRAYGVDISNVVWTDQDRVGLYVYETGQAPRGGRVIYDRANSAMAKMHPVDLPDLAPDVTRLLHLSGITLALSQSASETAEQLAQIAQQNNWRLSFDVNYRSLLWSAEEAREGCHKLASMADVLFLPLRDAVNLYGAPDDPELAITHMNELYPQAQIVMTLSAEGAIAKHGDVIARQPTFRTEPIGRLGGGDAFVAGYLYGYLNDKSLSETLKWGVSCAAYKYTMLGDMPLLDLEPIRQLVEDDSSQGLLR